MIDLEGHVSRILPPNLDTHLAHMNRVEFMNRLLEQRLCFSIHGELDKSIEVLNDLL
jgi:hypothetical protein